ncbi:hypothetical protein KIN20_010158 [Parelaphostrongylus tenuis]|uniref:PiggyBac transposable element-derived protein domain-containing protein n=1 Tax=Parelaphostrongylus tenuis TaxID=148309 RepID=A0AAD5QNW7_PARTN|nr:hypothetical protein KIN20_010158 [Parelaphostrongylus tenuis]
MTTGSRLAMAAGSSLESDSDDEAGGTSTNTSSGGHLVIDRGAHKCRWPPYKNFWKETTVNEMGRFIGLCLKMSAVRLPSMNDYLSARQGLVGVSMEAHVMPWQRFFDIMTHLHVADREYGKGQGIKDNAISGACK